MRRLVVFLLIGSVAFGITACGSKQVQEVTAAAVEQVDIATTSASDTVDDAASPITLRKKPHEGLVYPPLNNPKTPTPERIVLDNGMILYLLEDHELPIIDIAIRLRTGDIYEPADKVGLANITGSVMRTGGTLSKTGDELDEILESLAASVEVGIGSDSGSASMSVLKEDLDTGLAILADVLMNPAFREDKIELDKVQHRSAIARRNDDASDITSREFRKLVYGPESPYARTTEYATIDSITRDDLIAFHKAYFQPKNVILGVVGDFDSAELLQKLKDAFADWDAQGVEIADKPTIPDPKPMVALINKEDVNQTNIRMGHVGWLRSNEDYPALVVMSQILGIGFSSRLVNSIRVEKGLAYSVGCNYGAGYDVPGVFLIACGTKSESTVAAVEAILAEAQRMRTEEVTDEELKQAIDGFMNSSVFDYDTKSKILGRAVRYEYYDYPQDFVEQLMEGIRKVSKADVKRVAEQYVHPDKFTILAVGKSGDFDKPLSTLGEVTELDITIPVAASEPVPEAAASDVEKAQAILEQVIEAYGGLDALKSVQTVTSRADLQMNTPGGIMSMDMKQSYVLPDKQHVDMTIAGLGMEIQQVFDGQTGWTVTPQGTIPLQGSQIDELKSVFFRELVVLLTRLPSGELSFQHVGSETVGDKATDVILVHDEAGNSVKLFVEPETHNVVKKSYQTLTEEGPAVGEELIDDFREVDGVRFGFHVVAYRNSEKFMEFQIKEIKINETVDPAIFQQ